MLFPVPSVSPRELWLSSHQLFPSPCNCSINPANAQPCMHSSFSSRRNESCCVKAQSISDVQGLQRPPDWQPSQYTTRSLMMFFGAAVYSDAWWENGTLKRAPGAARSDECVETAQREIGRGRWRSRDGWTGKKMKGDSVMNGFSVKSVTASHKHTPTMGSEIWRHFALRVRYINC